MLKTIDFIRQDTDNGFVYFVIENSQGFPIVELKETMIAFEHIFIV